MTKSGILGDGKEAWDFPHDRTIVVDREYALKAMDEYAKQQAIAFHTFAKNAPLRYSERKGNYIKYHTYTDDQLYNQFIEQQNK